MNIKRKTKSYVRALRGEKLETKEEKRDIVFETVEEALISNEE